MSPPLVSVVLIVRNGERFLAAALDSIRAQDYRPLEVIVVDGQSTDATPAIAAAYPGVRIVQQLGRGIADANNLGIHAARGELIAFLSHDDLWTPDKVSAQVEYLSAHPEVAYCLARVKFFLEEGVLAPASFRPELLVGDHVGIIPEAMMARRRVFDDVGLFDPRLSLSIDTDWFARAKDAHVPMAVVPRVLLLKRIHDANASSTTRVVQRELLDVVKRSLARQRGQRAD